jgi:hypothetical protein
VQNFTATFMNRMLDKSKEFLTQLNNYQLLKDDYTVSSHLWSVSFAKKIFPFAGNMSR